MLKHFNLNEMTKGWFVGNFNPSILKTKEVEVGIKNYKKGEKEDIHYHKIATEITAIISGRVIMCEKEFKSGDIILLEPGTPTSFEVIEDTITVVVKLPCAKDDKYFL
jgi:quercetin dioxygenase-like cupin family protein